MKTLVETAAAVANLTVSPVELVEQALAAVEPVQAACNAFTVVMADEARALARELAEIDPIGPLHGVPIAIKDLYDLRGYRTTGCCAAYLDRPVASADSAVAAKLRAAGAIFIGKTNQHELACGATSQVSCFGPVLNPFNTAHIPGGSSGGSAVAVAAGVVKMAMGSDTGGSIREPASMCGVTGLKPTHGAVSLRGAMPMIPAFDSGGALAITAEDCLLVHRLLAGYDDGDPFSRADATPLANPETVRGLRLGIPRRMYQRIDPEVRAAVDGAAWVLSELGLTLVELDGPDPDEASASWNTRWAEVANCYRDLWDDDRPSDAIKRLLAIGRNISGPDHARGLETHRIVQREFRRAFERADILLAPTTPYPAPRIDAEDVPVEGGTLDVHYGGAVRLTMLANLAGLPALSIPVGFTSGGLPIGAQVIGPEFSEALICAVGSAYQAETYWHLRRARVGALEG
jgi:aspartyl-tRNA(Asn)/glutamyl-tRNA(Gln) amidotransferase subunit A